MVISASPLSVLVKKKAGTALLHVFHRSTHVYVCMGCVILACSTPANSITNLQEHVTAYTCASAGRAICRIPPPLAGLAHCNGRYRQPGHQRPAVTAASSRRMSVQDMATIATCSVRPQGELGTNTTQHDALLYHLIYYIDT